jgi:uncharacterized protein with GYD domain
MAKQVFFVEQREDGRYNVTEKGDVVAVVEAPDDISMTALGLSTGALGNVP